jgi:hypothetical protein
MGHSFAKCIYCGSPGPLSAEHVVPEALGGSWVLHCVCKPCNSRLGHKVDAPLVDNFLARLARQVLSIHGKGGIPNVFDDGMIALPGVGKHPAHYRMNADGSADHLEIATRIIKEDLGDGHTRVRAVADASQIDSLFAAVNKMLTRRGGKSMTREQFERSVVRGSTSQPEMEIEVHVGVNDHVPGLVKIVYEVAVYWLGDAYVDVDPIAAVLRDSTFDIRALDGHRGNVEIGFKMEGEPEETPDRHLHTIMLVRHGKTAVASVALFGNAFMCMFVVTDDADRYGFTKSRMIEMDTSTRACVEDDVPSDLVQEYLGGERAS